MATVEQAAADMASECAHARFVAAEALCRAVDSLVQVSPMGVSLGPKSAQRAAMMRQGVDVAEHWYRRATVAATASARLAESFRSPRGRA